MQFLDKLQNLITGLAGGSDKKVGNEFTHLFVNPVELDAMYRADWLSRKIIDIIPNDMTREWRDWQAAQDQIEAIEAVEKAPLINVRSKVNDAMKKARLMGGAIIFIGLKDATPSEPLDLDKIKAGDLQYLHVLSRYEATAGPLVLDVLDPYYGRPSYYQVTGSGTTVTVHPSRVVHFVGAEILDVRVTPFDGWGDSVLVAMYAAIQNAVSSQEHIASLIPEMKTDIIYVPGLSKFLQNPATTKLLTDRFTYANTIKSMFRMTLLEGNGGAGDTAQGEKWEQKQISFAQLPELMQQYMQLAAGAADIPVTRLLGQSPAGMTATGDSDLQNYYNNVEAQQRNSLQPRLNQLDEVIIRSATGKRDPAIHYSWTSLWGMSETEKATVFKTKADAARAIAGGSGMLPLMPLDALSDALVNEFIEDGSLAGLEAAIEKYGALSEQDDTEADVTAAAGSVSKPQQTQDAEPAPLYVRRDVLNGADIVAWARAQGFGTTLPASDMHVTITYSRTPVDWMAMGQDWSEDEKGNLTVSAGGARMMEQFGKATVLLFASTDLDWRHDAMVSQGASWDHPEYQPHITISYGFDGDLSKVEPYRGPIVLGPEVFEPIKDDWQSGISES